MKDAPQQTAFYRQLGASIRTCRKRSNLSQEGLATLIGLTRTSLTNIENGRQHPPLHTLCEIVEKLKVDISELLPRPLAAAEAVDITAMVGNQLRGADELAFIKSGLGIKNRGSHGDTETQDSSDGGITTR
ncbi:anaerobic benzoate catabolism transcriptional regulator [mine drainage metagenome]|uniref:Anaerobic benzoate catabolism transcriptional regulator n=1 Tax=mine drainage metagenome TaxID=410659 RepID=A0A1J5QXV0_9ZZZZ